MNLEYYIKLEAWRFHKLGMGKSLLQGTLLKHLEEHVIQSDMTRDDIMIYYTTVCNFSLLSFITLDDLSTPGRRQPKT